MSRELERLRQQVKDLEKIVKEKDMEISALREQLTRLKGNTDKFFGKRMVNLNAVL